MTAKTREPDSSTIMGTDSLENMKQKMLLVKALECLEYVTYHDGRYKQAERHDWMSQAQGLVYDLAAHLKVKAYKDYG